MGHRSGRDPNEIAHGLPSRGPLGTVRAMSRYVAPAPEAIEAFLAAHPRWSRDGAGLACTLSTTDFSESLALAVRIGCLAEKHDHHPDLDVRWGKLRVFWSTHDTGGLSTLDLTLATATDSLFSR